MRRWSARGRRGKLHGQEGSPISLVSLMDVLVCLLFFLLTAFLAGGEVTAPPPGLDLPRSTAEQSMKASLVVAIDHDDIMVGTERIASVKDAAREPGMVIEALAERVNAVRQQMDDLDKRRGSAAGSTVRLATIQGDEDIEFRVLQKVMYTLNQGGFEDIALAVLKKA